MSPVERFTPLVSADAGELSRLLLAQRSGYLAHFHPFGFEEEIVAAQLAASQLDRFWGIYVDGTLVGLVMLRGWDAGFIRPAFGVFISEEFSGRGLAAKALRFTIEYCRSRGIERVMLSAHPSHTSALRIYEAAGFRPTGERSEGGHDIYELTL